MGSAERGAHTGLGRAIVTGGQFNGYFSFVGTLRCEQPRRRVEGLYGGAASVCREPASSSASWDSGPPAVIAASSSPKLVLCSGRAGTPPGKPCCDGQQARGLRWPTPFWQVVALPATRRDAPDSIYGTLVWHIAGTGRAPAASPPVSGLEPRSPPGTGLAHGQPLQRGEAAQESAPRSYALPPAMAIGLAEHAWSYRDYVWLPVHTDPGLTKQMDIRIARLLPTSPGLTHLAGHKHLLHAETLEENEKEAAPRPRAA